MERIRTALVGCGKIGQTHAEILGTLSESHFVAVCDRDLARAQALAKLHQVKAYDNLTNMIVDSGIRMVVVSTPHPAHAVPTIKAIRAGAHVLVEKPMATSLKDCDAMMEAAEKAKIKLGVMSQRRLYEPVQRVKAAIEGGKIGPPVLGTVVMLGWRSEAYYRSDPWRGTWQGEGGGVLVNQAPHQLDLLQWFMGPIDELFGYWDNLNHPSIEVEDTAIAVVRFNNGSLGSIIVSNSQKPGLYAKVHVHGENGASVGVQTDGGAMFIAGMTEIQEPPFNDLWTVPGEERQLAQWQAIDRETFTTIDPLNHYHSLQVQDFLQALINDRDPLISASEGRKTVEIFTAIYRSRQERQPVKFPLQS